MEEELYIEDLNDPYYKVIVPDSIPHLFKGKDENDIFYGMKINEKLEKEYPHIYKAIKDEGYYISDYEYCYYFFEIPDKDDENIIGFATLIIHTDEILVLNQIYVMPEHRGEKTFINVLNYFMELFDEAKIYIKNPNKYVLDTLEELETFIQLDERFFLSKIVFMYDLVAFEDTIKYTNKSYVEQKGKIALSIPSNLYDKKLNSLVSLASQNNKPFTGKEKGDVKRCSMSLVRNEDQQQHNYLEKRCEDPWIKKGNYFKKVKKNVNNKINKLRLE